MSWNYRVTKSTRAGEASYEVREVYYGTNGKVIDWTVSPISIYGTTLADLRAELALMTKALSDDVVDLDQIRREVDGYVQH